MPPEKMGREKKMQGAAFIDAAVQLPNDSHGRWRTLMFQGDRALILNWNLGVETFDKIINLEKKWSTLAGTSYAQGVDAAVQLSNDSHGSWCTLLFKGARCLYLNWDSGINYEGPVAEFEKRWKQLSATVFANGVDTAIQLPNDSHGSWRTVLFKYVPQQDKSFDQYVALNWDAGIDSMGSVRNYEKQWQNIPSSYGSGFVALELPPTGSWDTMLFRDANCYKFNWDHGKDYEGPVTAFGNYWDEAYKALTS
jgi:hypothetical protein